MPPQGISADPQGDSRVLIRAEQHDVELVVAEDITITITNNGPEPATGVSGTNTFTLPAKVVSIDSSQSEFGTGPPIIPTIGTVSARPRGTITIEPSRPSRARRSTPRR